MGSSQEWDWTFLDLGLFNGRIKFVSIGDITVQDEGSCIHWCLEGALSWSHCATHLRLVIDAQVLDPLLCNRVLGCILSKEFRVGHCWVVEGCMVVHRLIEILSRSRMSFSIVFRALYAKVWYPTQLPIDVSFLRRLWVVWHSGSLEFILLIWIKLSLWLECLILLLSELFIEELLIMCMVCLVEVRWNDLVTTVPLAIVWS